MNDAIRTEQLANLIIAGVNKAGSTSLFHYLSSHPFICGSREKETCYFLPVLYGKPVGPLSDYQQQFCQCGTQMYRLETTPGYMYGGEKMAQLIYNTLPGVKIIIILKDPVERLISFYHRKKTTFQFPDETDFRKYVKMCFEKGEKALLDQQNALYTGIANGLYHLYIEPWLKIFGSNIKIVFFDDLKDNPNGLMTDLCNWLEIDSLCYRDYEFDIKNKSINYRNRYIQRLAVFANNSGQRFWRTNPQLKKKLLGIYYNFNGSAFNREELDQPTLGFVKEYFKPHNEQLFKLLQQYGISNFPAWLEPAKVTA
jgi:hypothetical protein